MNVPQLKNVEQLFQLGVDKIKKHKIEILTKPGENYGSIMLSVELIVETSKGEQSIYAVVKMVPPNEFLQKVFNTKVTFRGEIAFYQKIVPLLQNFQKENGVEKIINFTPEYYGSRLNLTGGDEVDGDAALVLENLKVKNFLTLERTKGLDFDTTKLIIIDLAHLHAVSLALKLKKSKVFENEVKPFLYGFRPDEKLQNAIKNDLIKVIDQIEEMVPLKERILEGFYKTVLPYKAREPFAAIVHDDCWTNNTMTKFEGATPVKNKIIDYQLCSYGSPAKDILFFLFTSVKNEVVLEKYHEVLKIYHESFLKILEELKCDTEAFSFENFLEEVDLEARWTQFGHIMFMLLPIFASKEELKDISEVNPEKMSVLANKITDLHKQKFIFVVNEFLKRNWI